MKRIFIVLVAVLFTAGLVNAQINVDCNGKVGIGIDPNSFIRCPEIKMITTDTEIVKPGNNAKIIINAEDDNKEALEYQFAPGLKKQKNDAGNVFTYTASSNFADKSTGLQIVKAVVINESNAVSQVKEIKIKGF